MKFKNDYIGSYELTKEDLEILDNYRKAETKIGFAILYKFFQTNGRFPYNEFEVSSDIVSYISEQLGVDTTYYRIYDWNGKTIINHRKQIRDLMSFRECTVQDYDTIKNWLILNVIPLNDDIEYIKDEVYRHFRTLKIEPATSERAERIINSAINTYENSIYENIFKKLPPVIIQKFEAFLVSETEDNKSEQTIWFQNFNENPDGANIDSVFKEAKKLQTIEEMDIPKGIFDEIPQRYLKKYYKRSKSENISELRRHPEAIKYSLLAVFFHFKSMEIKDNLVDLLVKIMNNLDTKAVRKVKKELTETTNYVRNKNKLLYKIAKAVVENPEAKTRDVIYPIADEKKLKNLIQELESKSDNVLNIKSYINMRSSYQRHYRRMLPDIMRSLKFYSNNDSYKPIIQAIDLIDKYLNSTSRHYSKNENIPIEGVVRPMWQDMIEDESKSKGTKSKVKRIDYELCALQALKDKIRCREVWINGADKYRNPDEDIPKDFDEKKDTYFSALNKPQNADEFIEKIKLDMKESLYNLNESIPKNKKVKILDIGNGRIKVSPLSKQPVPKNLSRLKQEILNRWSNLSLLDIFKEADLRINFTKNFKTTATHERLERETIRKRSLICLYGIGTNMGLKAVSSNVIENYMDIEYMKRKFINKDNIRDAITDVVNEILKVRDPRIWGSATTTCASDSKKFGAWDQNLRAEWHNRYHGRGIMIYWHVEKKSMCIYSQVKSCSSSEVASAIEGVLRHCTDMSVEKNYVDTHGQSEVGFAFCCLLGFKLMPRIKNIKKQKLYKPEISDENVSGK